MRMVDKNKPKTKKREKEIANRRPKKQNRTKLFLLLVGNDERTHILFQLDLASTRFNHEGKKNNPNSSINLHRDR